MVLVNDFSSLINGFFVVLLKLLDCVDDTVLVSKQILNEVKKNLMEVIQDKYGRLVLLQLLVPGNKRCVTRPCPSVTCFDICFLDTSRK